jgi:nucleoside-diphosphate-sugar epimerase
MNKIVVLGAAGFLGSHLCDELTRRGYEVIGVDDLSTGNLENINHLLNQTNFRFVQANICDGIPVEDRVAAVLNFASPASPPHYMAQPVHTLRTGSLGTEQAIQFSVENDARLIMASTSEVYGDPSVSPQVEEYWGNVNPIGVRSCYDEAKRYAEALCFAYMRSMNANIGIVRIFNTYGPRLDRNDGRVVSNFIWQSLTNKDLTVYGDGSQTRSFCYVDDQVRGILAMLDSDQSGPINLGNPEEFTILELAELVMKLTGTRSNIKFEPLPTDDPLQRRPDISKAQTTLGWEPRVSLRDGLLTTIDWFTKQIRTYLE